MTFRASNLANGFDELFSYLGKVEQEHASWVLGPAGPPFVPIMAARPAGQDHPRPQKNSGQMGISFESPHSPL